MFANLLLQTIQPFQLVVMVLVLYFYSSLVILSCRISLLHQGEFVCIVGLVTLGNVSLENK